MIKFLTLNIFGNLLCLILGIVLLLFLRKNGRKLFSPNSPLGGDVKAAFVAFGLIFIGISGVIYNLFFR